MRPPLIIHHAPCPDGFGAAWLLGKWLGEHEKYPTSYGKSLPPDETLADREVWLVDFCYPPDGLIELSRRTSPAHSVLILDHHESAVGYVAEAGIPTHDSTAEITDSFIGRLHAVIDQSHSGIGIVAQLVTEEPGAVEVPEFLYNLEDRDLWRFDLPYTREVFAAVTSVPYTDEQWDRLASMRIEDLEFEGAAIERYRQQLVQQCVDLAYQRHFETPPEFDDDGSFLTSERWEYVWVANAPYAICSDVAGELAKRDPARFAATFFIDDDGPKWSLRSTDVGTNVAEVAAKMQPGVGGGHAHAAGFRGAW